MKLPELYVFRDPETGLYFYRGYTPDEFNRMRYGTFHRAWTADITEAKRYRNAESGREWVKQSGWEQDDICEHHPDRPVEVVMYPHCGCCGLPHLSHHGLVAVDAHSGDPAARFRCEKHVGRNPCIIEGCGSTFNNKGKYDVEHICGKHWRKSPKYLRNRIAKIRKLAKRRGWTQQLVRIHDKLWYRAVAAVRDDYRPLDMTEINKMFGWD